jgi:hypothetical protein
MIPGKLSMFCTRILLKLRDCRPQAIMHGISYSYL